MDVLIVDDDPGVRKGLTRVLERAGLSVTAVENGLAAFAELQQNKAAAIVCDVNMPFLEGGRFYDEIERGMPELASSVIFITGGDVGGETGQMIRRTGRPLLQKPVKIRELVQTVSTIIDRGRPARVLSTPRSEEELVGATGQQHADTRKTVLLVDDDPGVRVAFSRGLERAGFDVKAVGGSVAAFAELRNRSFHVIVCDVILPIADGTTLYEEISIKFPEMADRMIFVSGWTKDDKIRRLLEYTGQPFLAKPVKLDTLVGTVRQVVARTERRPESGVVAWLDAEPRFPVSASDGHRTR